MGAFEQAGNRQKAPYRMVADSTVLAIPDNVAYAEIEVGSAQNIDVFDTPWREGREIMIRVAPGSGAAATFRDNQSGSNLAVANGTSAAIAAGSFVMYKAAYDASGNEMWYEIKRYGPF